MRNDNAKSSIEHLTGVLDPRDSHEEMISKLMREHQRQCRIVAARRSGKPAPVDDEILQSEYVWQPLSKGGRDAADSKGEEEEELDLSGLDDLDEVIDRALSEANETEGAPPAEADEAEQDEELCAGAVAVKTEAVWSCDNWDNDEEKTEEDAGGRLSGKDVAKLCFVDFSGKKRFLSSYSTASLLDLVQEYADTFSLEGEGSIDDYRGVARTTFVAANILLNERIAADEASIPAPAFRGRIKMRQPYTGPASDLSNDRQVIDLHYFWAKGHRYTDKHHMPAGLAEEVFDFDQSLRFCRTMGKTSHKLKALELDDRQSCLERLGAAVLRTDYDRKLQELINNSRSSFVSKLRKQKLPPATKPELWADILAAEKVLSSLGRVVTGRALSSVLQLIGTRDLPREDTLIAKLRSAKSKLRR